MTALDSWLYCPRGGKRLVMEMGQDDTGAPDAGLTVEHRCVCCERSYSELGPATPRAARITSDVVRAVATRLMEQRLRGWERPLRYDLTPFPVDELAEVSS